MERVALILKRLTVALTLTLVPGVGAAGVADSPLPELVPGVKSNHLYTVPGVNSASFMETFFSCTSMEKAATIQVGVEVFGSPGGPPANGAAATSLSVAPGATVVFGTGSAAGVSIDSNLLAGFIRGSARILATSKKLACTAFMAEPTTVPTTSMVHLTIIKKTKQKASN